MCALFTTGLSLFSSFSAAFGLVVEKKRAVVNVFRKVFRLDTPPKTFKQRERVFFADSLSPKSYVVQIAPCPCLWTRTVVQSPSPFPPKKKKTKKKLDGGVKQNKKKKKMCGGNVSKRSTFSSFFFISKEEKEDKNDETRPIPISLSLEYYSILISSRSVKRTRQRRDIVLSSQRKRKRKRHQTKRCDARQR